MAGNATCLRNGGAPQEAAKPCRTVATVGSERIPLGVIDAAVKNSWYTRYWDGFDELSVTPVLVRPCGYYLVAERSGADRERDGSGRLGRLSTSADLPAQVGSDRAGREFDALGLAECSVRPPAALPPPTTHWQRCLGPSGPE